MSKATEFLENQTPTELYDLKEALDKILIFGAWTKLTEVTYVRPEPAKSPCDSRVSVWYCAGKSSGGLAAGWYYRVGFGVVGLAGVSGTIAYQRAEKCMAAVDKGLARESDIVLVETAKEKELV